MKILIDEDLPIDFRHLLASHDVATVVYMGWKGLRNGQLLLAAAGQSFDVLLTRDAGYAFQHNRAALPLSVVVLPAGSNKLQDIVPLLPRLLTMLASLSPRSMNWL